MSYTFNFKYFTPSVWFGYRTNRFYWPDRTITNMGCDSTPAPKS